MFRSLRSTRSCTVGIPHRDPGQLVVACVVPHDNNQPGGEDIQVYARHYLSSYKLSCRVLFFRENERPMTGIDKIRRSELTAIVEKR